MADPTQLPEETTVESCYGSLDSGSGLIDIRLAAERQLGALETALVMSFEEVLSACRAGELTGGRHYVICQAGVRSLELVRRLKAEGFEGFSSVAGGFRAWVEAGFPVETPSGFSAAQVERYERHLVMPQVGLEGQRRLAATRILLAGLGGLNSPAALYLAAAGVGTLGLIDADRVESSNLQRQVIHDQAAVGRPKVESAAERLRALNPDTGLETLNCMIDEGNAADVVHDYDIVVDGTDNFAARYALNEACLLHGRPLVYGAVMHFQGQVSVFWPGGDADSPCFRCLMPEEPPRGAVLSCAQAGVLGVMPGVIGTLQAAEALKLALDLGNPLIGRLLMVDALGMAFHEARIARRAGCPSCSG